MTTALAPSPLHRWTSNSEPDPTNLQYEAAVLALQTICKAKRWPLESALVWCGALRACCHLPPHERRRPDAALPNPRTDYCSIPQLCRAIQGLAIDSLHAYAKHADVFVILAPKITHADKGTPCDYTSYQGRMYASRPPTSPPISRPLPPVQAHTCLGIPPFCRDVQNPGGVARSSCATP